MKRPVKVFHGHVRHLLQDPALHDRYLVAAQPGEEVLGVESFFVIGSFVVSFGFMLVVNAFTLMIASWLSQLMGINFVVDGFWPAFLGGLVVSIVSVVLTMIFKEDKKK